MCPNDSIVADKEVKSFDDVLSQRTEREESVIFYRNSLQS